MTASQGLIAAKVHLLCERIAEFARSGRSLDLGAAVSAYQRDVATEFLLGKSYNHLEQPDFAAAMTNVIKIGGLLWVRTKHLRWLGPTLHSLPLALAVRICDSGTAAFMRHVQASLVTITAPNSLPESRSSLSDPQSDSSGRQPWTTQRA